MPWLSILMALLTFFTSGGADKEKRASAARNALLVGSGTYAVTNHTAWGQENLGDLDGYTPPAPTGGQLITAEGDALAVNGDGVLVRQVDAHGAYTVGNVANPGSVPADSGSPWTAVGSALSTPTGSFLAGTAAGALGGSGLLIPLLLVGGLFLLAK